MEKGTVFIHRAIRYHDGETGVKRLIVLNEPSNNTILVCKTTSKMKRNVSLLGCNSINNLFVLHEDPFELKTWVQFDRTGLFVYNAAELLHSHFQGDIDVIGKLVERTYRNLITCMSYSEDIEMKYLNILQKEITLAKSNPI